MKVHYIQNDQTFLIANHCVAKNAVFRSRYFKVRFENKIRQYLSPLCEILSVTIHNDQFQILCQMGSRDQFVKHYKMKRKFQKKKVKFIPESTYIFSQAMANLQSSMAIHFNRKEKRTGAVFARRFTKIKVEGSSALLFWFKKLRDRIKLHEYNERWKAKRSDNNGNRQICRNLWANGSPEIKVFDRFFCELQGQSLKQAQLSNSNLRTTISPP